VNVLYCSCILSTPYFNQLFKKSLIKPTVQGIKFNRLIAEGLSSNGAHVHAFSSVQMNRKMSSKIFWKKQTEEIDNISYKYLFFINFSLLRHISLFLSSFFEVLIFKGDRFNTVVIGDILSSAVAYGSFFAGKLRGFKYVAIITDLPQFQGKNSIISKVIRGFRNFLLDNKDGYILVSENMKEKIKNLKNFIVIETIVDIYKSDNNNNYKYPKKIICYSGSLNKQYGLLKLVKAFEKNDLDNVELWIYGKGDLENDLIKLRNDRIKFFGMERNDILIEVQKKCTLLVNPRPSDLPFSNYSFPSKTSEYMQSGTPVLTTRIAGIPKEYNDFLYFFDDESIDGISKKISELLRISDYKYFLNKGLLAKKFINENKNKIHQGAIVFRFLYNLIQN
jgi:glycosyltransferase involved in cell wall biosynthesis